MADCTVLVLTYKGKHHLEYLLPTVSAALTNTPKYQIDVLIVDNGQDEPTRNYVAEHFPYVTYKYSPVNDYLFSLNDFIKELKTKYVLILNDDMRLHPNVLNELIDTIKKDKTLFAVTSQIRDWDDTYTASAVRGAAYTKGWLDHKFLSADESDVKYTLYPGGGAAIFNTEFFNELGGFDPLYRPAYSEDVDLGIRAWQKGWTVIYDPKAILYHREGGTIKDQFKKDKLEQTINRNRILWMLKNVKHKGFIFWFFVLFPYRLLINYAKGNKNVYKAMLQSISKWNEALGKRRVLRPLVSDEQWLPLLDKKYTSPEPSLGVEKV